MWWPWQAFWLLCEGPLAKVWNPLFVEQLLWRLRTLCSRYSYFSFMSVPYSGWGNCFPLPDFWMHPTRSDSLIHWATMNTLDPQVLIFLGFYFFQNHVWKILFNPRATYCIHAYPARIVHPMVISKQLGAKFGLLLNLKRYWCARQNSGMKDFLNLTTIDRFITHQLDLEKSRMCANKWQ